MNLLFLLYLACAPGVLDLQNVGNNNVFANRETKENCVVGQESSNNKQKTLCLIVLSTICIGIFLWTFLEENQLNNKRNTLDEIYTAKLQTSVINLNLRVRDGKEFVTDTQKKLLQEWSREDTKLFFDIVDLETPRMISAVAGFACLIALFVVKRKAIMRSRFTKNLAFLFNTVLVLLAAWTFTESDSMVAPITMVICAASNSFLLVMNKNNTEFTTWLTYTINVFLIAMGYWIYDDRTQIPTFAGYIVTTIALINLFQHYIKTRAKY